MAPKMSRPRASESQAPVGFVLNTTSGHPEKRKAPDGRLYRYKDFIDHYGEWRGNEKWTQATKIRTFDSMGAEYLETLQPDEYNLDVRTNIESESFTDSENTLNIVKNEIPVAKSIEEHDGFKFNILLRKQAGKTLGCGVAWDTRERNF